MHLCLALIVLLFTSHAFCYDLTVDLISQTDSFYSFSGTKIHHDKAYFIGALQNTIWEYDPDADMISELSITGNNIYEFIWADDAIFFLYDSFNGGKLGIYDPETGDTTALLTTSTKVHSLVAWDNQTVCMCQQAASSKYHQNFKN